MNRSMINFSKGIIAGVVLGAGVSAAVQTIAKPVHPIKRGMEKAAHKVNKIAHVIMPE